MKNVFPSAALLRQLADLLAGDLAAATVHLYQNDYTPTEASLVTDFTEADYTGYANQVIGAWGDPFFDGNNNAVAYAPSLQFQPTGTTVTNTVYGVYVKSAGGGTPLVYSARFDTPQPMGSPANAVIYLPTASLGNLAA